MQSYEKIISGEQGLLRWIIENATEEGLDKDLPDDDSLRIAMPEIAEMNFVAGMLDGIMGKTQIIVLLRCLRCLGVLQKWILVS